MPPAGMQATPCATPHRPVPGHDGERRLPRRFRLACSRDDHAGGPTTADGAPARPWPPWMRQRTSWWPCWPAWSARRDGVHHDRHADCHARPGQARPRRDRGGEMPIDSGEVDRSERRRFHGEQPRVLRLPIGAPAPVATSMAAALSDRHVGALPVMIDDKPVRLSPRHRAAAVSLAHRHRNGRHVRAGCPSPHSPVRPSYPGGNVGGVQSVHFTPVLSFAAHVAQFVPLQ